MYRVLTCLVTEHDLRLVVLAGIVCFLASLASVNLFRRAFETGGRVQLTWILLAGAATGCGIWATHFIAMLAYEPGFVVGYDLALTALSLVAAVSVTSAGIAFAVLMQGRWADAIGGAVVGFGIGCMHYTGILAAEMPAHILWRLELVAASFVFGMALSAAAFVVAVRFAGVRGLVGGATLFTLAIVAHHFTGMGAIGIIPDPLREIDGLTLSPTAIAVAIASLAPYFGLLSGGYSLSILSTSSVLVESVVSAVSRSILPFSPTISTAAQSAKRGMARRAIVFSVSWGSSDDASSSLAVDRNSLRDSGLVELRCSGLTRSMEGGHCRRVSFVGLVTVGRDICVSPSDGCGGFLRVGVLPR